MFLKIFENRKNFPALRMNFEKFFKFPKRCKTFSKIFRRSISNFEVPFRRSISNFEEPNFRRSFQISNHLVKLNIFKKINYLKLKKILKKIKKVYFSELFNKPQALATCLNSFVSTKSELIS